MTYTATWTNANPSGRLEPGVHYVRDDDPGELADAINRRRRLVYLSEQDFSSQIDAGLNVRAATIATQTAPPFDNLRDNIVIDILSPAAEGLGGTPPTPGQMDWLWPVADSDEDKVLVATNPQAGEVALMAKLNQAGAWTDASLAGGQTAIRAAHFNEVRQAIEWITRGRWRMPVYISDGLFSLLPNTPWIGDSIANNGADELRGLGFVVARTSDSPALGLVDAAARSTTKLELTADTDCQVEVYRCLRDIDFAGDPATWNEYDPSASAAWATAGGTGAGDASYIGAMGLTADVTGELTNSALTSAVQAMIDGAKQNFLFRRSDTGSETIDISAELVVEFDLDSPPN